MADADANAACCGVCCETFTAHARKEVVCNGCDFQACTKCHQQYLLDQPGKPQCMNCKRVWDRAFLQSQFSKTFVNKDLKTHRENVIYEIERSLLPDTQPYAENELKAREMESKRKVHVQEAKEVQNKMNKLPVYGVNMEILKEKKELAIEMFTLKQEISFLSAAQQIMRRHDGKEAPVERRDFVKPCPGADCRGFLSTAWKCGLCELRVCSKCHEVKSVDGGDHVCNPDTLATVEAIAKDSKPCPKCGALISRIEGCSQMFHTPLSGGCGAVFDWKTLRLHNGSTTAIHNPHWYEYQRHLHGGNAPRQLNDIPCGGVPDFRNLMGKMDKLITNNRVKRESWSRIIRNLHRAYHHNQEVVLTRYAVDIINDNRDIRINFLLRQIDIKRFKQLLQQREKAFEKKQQMGEILQMHQTAMVDTPMLREFETLVDAVVFH